MSVQRLGLRNDESGWSPLMDDDEGEYVFYEDYKKLEEKFKKLKKELIALKVTQNTTSTNSYRWDAKIQ